MAGWLSEFIEDLFPSKETLRAKSVTLSDAAALLYLDTADVQRLGTQRELKLIKLDGEIMVMKPSLRTYYHANQEAINQRKAKRERERAEVEAEQERARAEVESEQERARADAELERKRNEEKRKRAELLLSRIFVHPEIGDLHIDRDERGDALFELLERNPQDAQAHLELGVCWAIGLGYDWLLPETHTATPQEVPILWLLSSPLFEEFLKAISLGLDTALLSGLAHFYYAMVTYRDAIWERWSAWSPSTIREDRDSALQKAAQAENRAETVLKEAVRQFRRWLSSNPHDLDALSFLSAAYERLGRTADVERIGLEIAKAEQLQKLGVVGKKMKQSLSTKAKGIAFEELCMRLVKAMGFSATTTSVTADGGIDIVATSTQPLFSGKYIIQCKDWSNTVGEPVVRDLYGVVHAENANKGVLIATSKFTKAAQRFAEGKPLELIDGEQFNDLLKQYKIQ